MSFNKSPYVFPSACNLNRRKTHRFESPIRNSSCVYTSTCKISESGANKNGMKKR